MITALRFNRQVFYFLVECRAVNRRGTVALALGIGQREVRFVSFTRMERNAAFATLLAVPFRLFNRPCVWGAAAE